MYERKEYTTFYIKSMSIVKFKILNCLLSLRNALRWGYSNAAVVPCVRPCVCVRPSGRPGVDIVNTIETTPLHVSLSNLADMLTMMRG